MTAYTADKFLYKEFPAHVNDRKTLYPDTLGIVRILSGETVWHIGQETLRAKPDDLIFLCDLEFRQRLWCSPDLRISTFSFPVSLLNGIGSTECLRVFYGRGKAFTHRLTSSSLLSVYRAIREEITSETPSRDMLMGYTLQLLAGAAREYDRIPDALTRERPDMSTFTRIAASVAYIHDHLTEPLSVRLLAEQAHISEGHYARMFTKYVATTPADYIARCRIHLFESKRSLGDTVLDTAFACGFTSASGFYKTYNRIVGHPPTK
jgi:AraC-like DNA-binding protein